MPQAKIINFPGLGPNLSLVATLESLLERAKSGQIMGLLYLVQVMGDGHGYGMAGSYEDHPTSAYIPACKGLYSLSLVINKSGGMRL